MWCVCNVHVNGICRAAQRIDEFIPKLEVCLFTRFLVFEFQVHYYETFDFQASQTDVDRDFCNLWHARVVRLLL